MSEELIKNVQEMLKEETWTRAAISNYTKNNLIELAAVIEKARNENCADEIKTLCDEHLTHSKDSIIALYFSGILALDKGTLDNSALVSLVDIFKKNHKEAVVEYLCESILADDPNNKFALRTLADRYRAENNEKVWELYERIVKLDYEEAELAKALAEHYEELSDSENAIAYYKKALLRYVSAKNLNIIKEVWTKLISLIPEEIDFFLLVQRKVAKTISDDKSALLMQELYTYYKDTQKWDTAIDILKLILSIDPKDNWARKEIIECFKGKYAGHSHLDDYIRSSNLTQNFRNVFEAISDFEKHIAFDAKNFVFHRSWGVGIIRKVHNDILTINFGKRSGIHEMSLKMAVNALTPLAKNHIWVLKATKSREELAKKIKDEKEWALKTIIKSFDNNCDFKRIKAELVDSILTPGEWTSWNTAAKKILESNSSFGVNPNDINMYTVREHEISLEEKLSNEFKAQKQFFARIEILMKFVNADETDKGSELFADMFSYFTSFLKTVTKVNEQILASYLVVRDINAKIPSLAFPIKYTFKEIYDDIENPRAMYDLLKDSKNTSLQANYLAAIKMLPDWADQYIRLFPAVLSSDMLKTLINSGHTEKVQKLAQASFENSREYREAALYLFKECQNEKWFKEAGIPYEKQLIGLLNIITQTFREINNHVNTTENKKINRTATQLLFKDDTLLKYMIENGEDTITRMYTLIDDITDLESSIKATLRNKILEKYPEYKFHTAEEKTSAPSGMLVTVKKLEEKQALVDQIQNVDIPANAKDLSEARSQGDLKENAEYKAAKEHQHYLTVTLAKLQEELNRSVIFDPTTITTSVISFATKVTLLNKDTGKDETYTILGPWESDPDNGIISYMSPFGDALLDHKAGEDISFVINEHSYNYTVKAIKAAKI
ncbi:transcription elongation factor GreA [Treponema parvum]|uniref:Transcription elongation factor GreA n=1 Tax=Treponema parvum TaxID=138851 RepID=A0A975IFM4_9SPIR|nr:transcription elongation factor GreA [Treponema parvum]QTQ14504.1 transcription elongation factor GreA [Treponema parvum]